MASSGQSARVGSIDALKQFRAALWKFSESADLAMGDAESEMNRVLLWLETEQHAFWTGQVRKRTEAVTKAKEALRYKKIFKDASGRTPSAVDEEKALAIAMRRLAEAEQKIVNVRRYTLRLQKEMQAYKGSVQRFATSVQVVVPAAVARLDKAVASLEAYISLAPGAASVTAATSEAFNIPATDAAESMARGDVPAPQIPAQSPPQLAEEQPAPPAPNRAEVIEKSVE